MPRATAADGVELHYEERGSGPLVVLSCYWSLHPSAFEPIARELERDHRVVTYHDRGSGLSERSGPYDLDTAAADLLTVIEAAGGSAVVAGVADGPSRGVRALVERPDLVTAVVGAAGAPVGRTAFEEADVLASSESVVGALLQQVETDYRGVLRSVLAATNAQMGDDELRERVAAQAEHCPVEAAAPRLRAWAVDEPAELGRAAADRLWVLVSERLSGGWFPAGAEMARVVTRVLPEAHVVEVDDGWVSRPDQTAAVIRRVTTGERAPAGENRINA